MINIHIVVVPNEIQIESDTATFAEVLPVLEAWFNAIQGSGNAEEKKIEFVIHPPEDQK